MRAASSVFAIAVVCALPGAAVAQEAAAAEAAFREGRALIKNGDYAAACKKFEQSYALEHATGTLLNLGNCYEKSGQIASAWATFRKAADRSRLQNRRARVREAERRADALESKLSYVRVTVVGDPEDIRVTRDGEVPFAALNGSPVPVDSGEHYFEATAPGKKTWSVTITVEGAGTTVHVEIPALEDVKKSAEPAPVVTPAPRAPVFVKVPTKLDETARWKRRRYAVGIGGAGVLAVGAAFLVGQSARSRWREAGELGCNDNICPTEESFDAAKSANRRGLVADSLVVVGAAAIATGAIVWLTAPDAERVPISVSPSAGVGHAGFVVSGSF